MINKLAIKSSLLGSFGSVAYASTIIDIPDNRDNKPLSPKISTNQKRNYTTQGPPENVTIEDIEMFQENTGCRLVFTDKFGEKKNYTAREWFNEKMKSHPEKEKKWRDALAIGVVYEKKKWSCKEGVVVILEIGGRHNDEFKTKFRY